MRRLVSLALILFILTLVINYSIGDIAGKLRKRQIDDELINVEKEDNSHLFNFVEISKGVESIAKNTSIKPYHQNFLKELKSLPDRLYKRKRLRRENGKWSKLSKDGQNVIREINLNAIKADDIVLDIFKEINSYRTKLGVIKNPAPAKFITDVNETIVLNEIMKELKSALIKTIGCKDCYTPHIDLEIFLNWLLRDDASLTCCRTETKQINKYHRIFNHKNVPLLHCDISPNMDCLQKQEQC